MPSPDVTVDCLQTGERSNEADIEYHPSPKAVTTLVGASRLSSLAGWPPLQVLASSVAADIDVAQHGESTHVSLTATRVKSLLHQKVHTSDLAPIPPSHSNVHHTTVNKRFVHLAPVLHVFFLVILVTYNEVFGGRSTLSWSSDGISALHPHCPSSDHFHVLDLHHGRQPVVPWCPRFSHACSTLPWSLGGNLASHPSRLDTTHLSQAWCQRTVDFHVPWPYLDDFHVPWLFGGKYASNPWCSYLHVPWTSGGKFTLHPCHVFYVPGPRSGDSSHVSCPYSDAFQYMPHLFHEWPYSAVSFGGNCASNPSCLRLPGGTHIPCPLFYVPWSFGGNCASNPYRDPRLPGEFHVPWSLFFGGSPGGNSASHPCSDSHVPCPRSGSPGGKFASHPGSHLDETHLYHAWPYSCSFGGYYTSPWPFGRPRLSGFQYLYHAWPFSRTYALHPWRSYFHVSESFRDTYTSHSGHLDKPHLYHQWPFSGKSVSISMVTTMLFYATQPPSISPPFFDVSAFTFDDDNPHFGLHPLDASPSLFPPCPPFPPPAWFASTLHEGRVLPTLPTDIRLTVPAIEVLLQACHPLLPRRLASFTVLQLGWDPTEWGAHTHFAHWDPTKWGAYILFACWEPTKWGTCIWGAHSNPGTPSAFLCQASRTHPSQAP